MRPDLAVPRGLREGNMWTFQGTPNSNCSSGMPHPASLRLSLEWDLSFGEEGGEGAPGLVSLASLMALPPVISASQAGLPASPD